MEPPPSDLPTSGFELMRIDSDPRLLCKDWSRGWSINRFAFRAKIRPYLLYSVTPDFTSSGGEWIDQAFASPRVVPSLNSLSRYLSGFPFFFVSFLVSIAFLIPVARAQQSEASLELSRPVRAWEFLPVVGTRAGLFADESGHIEAWVYPLKILRAFHLTFHIGGRALPAENLARTLTVHPESATLLYAGDSFRVTETLFVPVHEPGAVIVLEVQTAQPLEVEAGFVGDFALEWPAAIGGTYQEWDAGRREIVFGEETRKFAALVGSPTAEDVHVAYETNYSSSNETSFRLGVTQKGRETKVLVIAASVAGLDDAQKTYDRLAASYEQLQRDSAEYYHNYLAQTVSLALPDHTLQQAYDWARVSMIQGLVANPYLGTGLVAGYRTAGMSQRPGFAWFFGRDSLWTSFALNAAGDYSTTRTALEFLSKYQRKDGKVPHEIAQGASFVQWFKDYPYAFASADATPLFIIAMEDYVRQSGDIDFLREQWDNVWRAYQFLRSTYDAQGFAQNAGIGHGWVEGGPLLPVKTAFYQSGLGVEALRSLSNLAGLVGKDDVKNGLAAEFERQKAALDLAFWSPQKKSYAFALDQNNHRVDESSVLSTVPMWFGLSDPDHSEQMITELADADHETDWGMRIISSHSIRYDASGYHFGAVWPLFTGWASVGEYRYHRDLPAYLNLRDNALLGLDGSLGHFTEVLSGDFYQGFSTSSPHQIWSAAMVVSPVLRGLFGLQTDAENHQITLAPHLPADWTSFAIRNVHLENLRIDFQFHKTLDTIMLETTRKGTGNCWIEFSPALSLRTQVVSVEMNGKPLPFKIQANAEDQHVSMRLPLSEGSNTLAIRIKNDFGLTLANELPPLGGTSRGLRVISSSWSSDRSRLTLEVSGVPGIDYEVGVWNPAQINSVEGAVLTKQGKIRVQIPGGRHDDYLHHSLVIHLSELD
jgi:glycogen debranching enzyme